MSLCQCVVAIHELQLQSKTRQEGMDTEDRKQRKEAIRNSRGYGPNHANGDEECNRGVSKAWCNGRTQIMRSREGDATGGGNKPITREPISE